MKCVGNVSEREPLRTVARSDVVLFVDYYYYYYEDDDDDAEQSQFQVNQCGLTLILTVVRANRQEKCQD